MFHLKDGGLYETQNGRRFRVRYNKSSNMFECPRSYKGAWYSEGVSNVSICDDLVREIEEMRWVPIYAEDVKKGMVVRITGTNQDHWQELVTRKEAQRRAPNYQEKAKVATAQKPALNIDGKGHAADIWGIGGITWVFHLLPDGKAVVDIETSGGLKMTAPL